MLNTINMNDYYHECLYSFHSFAGVDIVKSVPLEELDHKVVVELMNNRQVLSDLADDRPQYECVILCRAVQCGAILADLFGKNVNSLKDQDVIHNIIDDPELYSEYGHWLMYITDIYLPLCDSDSGDFRTLPFPGGILDQPYMTMQVLKVIQMEYRKHISEKNKNLVRK